MFKLEQAQNELNKVIKYLEDNENVWNETRNLKLYEALCYDFEKEYPYCWKNNVENKYFHNFCEDEYYFFLEDMKENNITDYRKYIGRTSSFYLTNISDKNIDFVLNNLLCELEQGFNWLDINDGKLSIFQSNYTSVKNEITDDDVQDELEYICNDFYKDTQNFLKDAIWIAEYVDDFKKNQVEYFKNFLEQEEENLKFEKEKEERKYKNDKMTSYSIQQKYQISGQDMNTLKNAIYAY